MSKNVNVLQSEMSSVSSPPYPPPPPERVSGIRHFGLECVLKYLVLWMKKVLPAHFLFRFTLVSGRVGVLYVTVESPSVRIMT